MTSITATKARKQFFKLIENANQPGREVIITLDGKPKIIMMSYEEFEGWQETLEIMSDKKLMEGIREGLNDVRKGNIYSADEIKKKLNLK